MGQELPVVISNNFQYISQSNHYTIYSPPSSAHWKTETQSEAVKCTGSVRLFVCFFFLLSLLPLGIKDLHWLNN